LKPRYVRGFFVINLNFECEIVLHIFFLWPLFFGAASMGNSYQDAIAMLRDTMRGVARNTSIMFLQQIITWSSTLVLLMFLPRYLGPIEYGRLFLVVSISGIFLIFVEFGAKLELTKAVSRSKENTAQLFVNAMALRLVLWAMSLAGVFVFTRIADYPVEVTTMLIIAGVGLAFDTATTCLYACYQGNEQLHYTSLGIIVKRLFISLVGVIALLAGADALIVLIVLVIGSILNALVLISFSKKIITSIPQIEWRTIPNQIKKGLPYFLLIAFSTISYRIDSIMLSKMSPENVVGWYGAAYRLYDSLTFFPHLISVALYPVLSRLWKSEDDIHRRAATRSLEYVVILGVMLCAGVLSFGREVVHLLYGLPSYEQSIAILQILVCGLLFLYVDMLIGTVLLSSDKQKQQTLLALAGIPINMGLNFFLIPLFQNSQGNGGIGAAMATVLTELCFMIALLFLTPAGIVKGFRGGILAKSLFAALCMFASISLMEPFVPWLVQLPVSLLIYVAAMLATKTFELEERKFLYSVFAVSSIKDLKRTLFANDFVQKGE
jgi:O-antigen/teichoic acid export membrane protein